MGNLEQSQGVQGGDRPISGDRVLQCSMSKTPLYPVCGTDKLPEIAISLSLGPEIAISILLGPEIAISPVLYPFPFLTHNHPPISS